MCICEQENNITKLAGYIPVLLDTTRSLDENTLCMLWESPKSFGSEFGKATASILSRRAAGLTSGCVHRIVRSSEISNKKAKLDELLLSVDFTLAPTLRILSFVANRFKGYYLAACSAWNECDS